MAGSAFEGVEGDVNLSPHRAEWMRGNIGAETSRRLEEDSHDFLHQALSTPCLNVLAHKQAQTGQSIRSRATPRTSISNSRPWPVEQSRSMASFFPLRPTGRVAEQRP